MRPLVAGFSRAPAYGSFAMTSHSVSITIPMFGYPMLMRAAAVINLLGREGCAVANQDPWCDPGCRMGQTAEAEQCAAGKGRGEQ
jgi:hypothetical protein